MKLQVVLDGCGSSLSYYYGHFLKENVSESIASDRSGSQVNIFLISPLKHSCGYPLEVPH